MDGQPDNSANPLEAADAVLAQAITGLEAILSDLCGRLNPFPPFLGMATIQAVEVESPHVQTGDRGCVVVTPDGSIYELEVAAIPGIVGVLEVDQVEQFKPLDATPDEYFLYQVAAIRTLAAELRLRGG